MLAGLSPQRRRFVVGVAALAAALLVVAGVVAYVGRDPAVDPVPQAKPGPVLLVPGYGGSESGLDELASTLRAGGRDVSIVHLLGDGTGDLRKQAQVLADTADDVLRRTGAGSVDVVGYSAGGVIARLWVADYGGGSLARRVVMLGSPNHGTNLAGLAADVAPDFCPAACLQLAPDSDLLRALNAHDETPAGPAWVSIWSEADQVVVPPDSASVEGAVDFSVQSVCGSQGPLRDLAHGDLPRDPTVSRLVSAELGVAAPSVPAASTC